MHDIGLAMPITCAVCGKRFNSIGEVADHIAETYKGMQGDLSISRKEQIQEIKENEKEREHYIDASRGFAHTRFRDKNGVLLPEEEVITLYNLTMAGPHWCVDCEANFANNFRLAEHYNLTGHGDIFRASTGSQIREFQELERKYF
jgi:hypothetical protein